MGKGNFSFRRVTRIYRLHEDWITPVEFLPYIDALLGDIDLDPCTTEKANQEFIRAKNFYTQEDDGLNIEIPWTGKVYLFPPSYGRCSWNKVRGTWRWGLRGGANSCSPSKAWFNRLVKEWKLGNVYEALMFSINPEVLRTTPEIWDFPVCIPSQRPNLIHGKNFFVLPTPFYWGFFVYLPPRELGFSPSERFRDIFSHLGKVIG